MCTVEGSVLAYPAVSLTGLPVLAQIWKAGPEQLPSAPVRPVFLPFILTHALRRSLPGTSLCDCSPVSQEHKRITA